MKQIGVIFLSKKLTTKKGHAYYSGKTEGAEGFNLMAFVRESKTGSKYLSLVTFDDEPTKQEKQPEVQVKTQTAKDPQMNIMDNTESIIDPDDLPF